MGFLIAKNVTGMNSIVNQYNNVSLPFGIEYERLERKLMNNIDKKYNIVDTRFQKDIQQKMVVPGVCNKNGNQSSINFEEPNTKPAYPDMNIPYSQGLIWE